MIVWRLIKVLLTAFLVFVVFNFLLSNFDANTLGYKVHFQFNIPPFLYLESTGLPVGILLLISFCLGMIFAAFIGAFTPFYRVKELKSKNKTIRQLEIEIEELRKIHLSNLNQLKPKQDNMKSEVSPVSSPLVSSAVPSAAEHETIEKN